MNKVILTSLVAAAVLLGTAPAFAQDADVSVETSVNVATPQRVMENRAEMRSEIQETRMEMRSEVEEEREENAEVRTEMRAEAVMTREDSSEEREEAMEERKEKREEMAEDREEKREEMQTKVRTMRGDVIMRLANNIIVRLEASIAKLTQINTRIETAVNEAKAEGIDTTESEGHLAASATFMAEAQASLTNFAILIGSWEDVDVASETFGDALAEYKEELRTNMKEARNSIRSAGEELRAAVKSLKEARKASVEAEVEAEDDTADDSE